MCDTDMTQPHEQARKLESLASSRVLPLPVPLIQSTPMPAHLTTHISSLSISGATHSQAPTRPSEMASLFPMLVLIHLVYSMQHSRNQLSKGQMSRHSPVFSLQWLSGLEVQASEYGSCLPLQHCCIPPTSNLRVQAHESLGFHHKPCYFCHPRPCLGNSLYLEVPSFPFALFRSNSYSLCRIQLRDCTLQQVCSDSPCSWGQAPLQKPLVIAYGPI